MTSALSPRDIQSRIRAGATLEDVAAEAGVDAAKVEPFAAPVLAEREHVAGTALQCPVRRRGESSSARSLRTTVTETLQGQGFDAEQVEWDAWRDEDRTWTVKGTWTQDNEAHEALFAFDQKGRFSVARNDDSRRLIGEAIPGEVRPRDVDAEPTIDLNDELAIVRAVQGDAPIVDEVLQQQVLSEVEQETVRLPRPTPEQVETREEVVQPEAGPKPEPEPETAPAPGAVELEDVEDYSEAELEQVDGVYDIVPKSIGEMDVLYEMLSSFNEESVNIYAGLTEPVAPQVAPEEAVSVDVVAAPVMPTSAASPDSPDSPDSSDSPASPDSPGEPDEDDSDDEEAEDPDVESEDEDPDVESEDEDPESEDEADEQVEHTGLFPRPEAAQAEPAEVDPLEQDHLDGMTDQEVALEHKIEDEDVENSAPEVDADPEPVSAPEPQPEPQPETAAPEPEAQQEEQPNPLEQDALIESPEPVKAPAKKRSRSKRASVPSWDEIMFGSPMPGHKD